MSPQSCWGASLFLSAKITMPTESATLATNPDFHCRLDLVHCSSVADPEPATNFYFLEYRIQTIFKHIWKLLKNLLKFKQKEVCTVLTTRRFHFLFHILQA